MMSASKIYNAIPDATIVCSIILAFLLHHYYPVVRIVPFPANLVGWPMIVAGIGLAAYILTALKSKRTSTDAAGVPAEFITRGPYAVSRNPFYLSYVVIAMGTAVVLGSLTAFVAPVVCFAVIQLMIIPLEERILQQRFGQQYARYQQSVRRWI